MEARRNVLVEPDLTVLDEEERTQRSDGFADRSGLEQGAGVHRLSRPRGDHPESPGPDDLAAIDDGDAHSRNTVPTKLIGDPVAVEWGTAIPAAGASRCIDSGSYPRVRDRSTDRRSRRRDSGHSEKGGDSARRGEPAQPTGWLRALVHPGTAQPMGAKLPGRG
jgi:hypothetical protein